MGSSQEEAFHIRRYTAGDKHMRRCSTSLAIKEMQTKTSNISQHTYQTG